MNGGIDDVKRPPATGRRLVLLHPWRQRNVYSDPGHNSNLFSYPIHPNSIRVMPKGAPLRMVHFAPPPPHFGRPGFPTQQFLSHPSYSMPQPMPTCQSNSPLAQPLLPPSLELIQPTCFQESSQKQPLPLLNFHEKQLEQIQVTNYQESKLKQLVQSPDFHELQEKELTLQATNFQPLLLEHLESPDVQGAPEYTIPFEEDNYSTTTNATDSINPKDNTQECQQLYSETRFKYISEHQGSPSNNIAYNLQEDVSSTVFQEETKEAEVSVSESSVGFNSIEEALMALDGPNSSSEESSPAISPITLTDTSTPLKIKMGPKVHDEVVKAAKSLFSKRTRTLYHWLYPETSKAKLKASVTSAWDTLPENEKLFYMSQVLGRFGLQAGSLMINPQLDGIKGFNTDSKPGSDAMMNRKKEVVIDLEAERAVEDLFASCDDSDCWISYPWAKQHKAGDRRRKRRSENGETMLSQAVDYSAEKKKNRQSDMCNTDFQGDVELQSELEKFRLFSDSEELLPEDKEVEVEDDVWRRSPKTRELFEQLGI